MAKQQLPKLRVYKTTFAAHYKPHLHFYELLMPAALKFGEYPHWQTDRLKVNLRDYDKRCNLTIGHNAYSFDQDFNENDYQMGYIEKALTVFPEAIEISTYKRLGFRRKYLAPVQMKYYELVLLFFVKTFSNDKFDAILPGKVDDLSFTIDFLDDKLKFKINAGPIAKKQIADYIAFDKENHLDPKTREKDFIEIEENYPEAAIFVDIDIFRDEGDIPITEGIPFLKEAAARMVKFAIDFRDFLLAQVEI